MEEKAKKDTKSVKVSTDLYEQCEALAPRVGELVGFKVNPSQTLAWLARKGVEALTGPSTRERVKVSVADPNAATVAAQPDDIEVR